MYTCINFVLLIEKYRMPVPPPHYHCVRKPHPPGLFLDYLSFFFFLWIYWLFKNKLKILYVPMTDIWAIPNYMKEWCYMGSQLQTGFWCFIFLRFKYSMLRKYMNAFICMNTFKHVICNIFLRQWHMFHIKWITIFYQCDMTYYLQFLFI